MVKFGAPVSAVKEIIRRYCKKEIWRFGFGARTQSQISNVNFQYSYGWAISILAFLSNFRLDFRQQFKNWNIVSNLTLQSQTIYKLDMGHNWLTFAIGNFIKVGPF